MSVHFGLMSVADFGCIGKGEVDLDKPGLVFVAGRNNDSDAATSNGAGKSTIWKALTWCLYEATVDGDRADAVIRRGAKQAKVSLRVARDGGAAMTVVRVRRKGSTKLTLLDEKGSQIAVSKPQAQGIIEEAVGLDFASFRNTVLYGQNDAARFADSSTTDGQRKEMMRRLLKTTVYQDCYEAALVRRATAARETAELEAVVRVEASRLAEHDVDAIRLSHAAWEKVRRERADGFIGEAKRYMAEAADLTPDGSKIEALTTQRAEAVERTKVWKGMDRLDELKSLASTTESRRIGYELDVRDGTHELERLRAELDRLSTGLCPVCTSPLDGGAPERYKADLRGKVAGAVAEIDASTKALAAVTAKLHDAEAEVKAEHRAAQGHHEAKDEVARLEREIADEGAVQAGIEAEVELAAERARGYLDRVREIKAEVNPHTERLASAERRTVEVRAKIVEAETKLSDLGRAASRAEFWVRGFGPQGLPSLLLDSTMPILTERANHYLGTLADGDIFVEFTTQRELKTGKGEMRDEIQIRRTVEGHEGVTPSGGQLKKISIAVDLALMDLAAMREGEGVSLLALDEVLDGLDAEGRARVLLLLRELRASRGSVYVTSHEADVSPVFERTLLVEKTGGEATVREVA